ncbi:MAG: 4-hydroxy-tetrahydrodipicolinate reductase [Deltaproteobacteria bacterium]|nr:4-hydroxy-tetrahydrodipicolinate reductase [Deltaproteobacteria bacterium]
MTLKLSLIGASGRAGKEVLRVLPEFSQFSLVSAITSGKGSSTAQSVGCAIPFSSDLKSGVAAADCVLEFTSAAASVEVAKLCALHQRPLVLASSGHTEDQLAQIRVAAQQTAIFHSANLSLGVFVLHEISKHAQRLLGPSYQVEIFEMHHRHKKDAPSGTALSLARHLAAGSNLETIRDRGSRVGSRKDSELGVSALRGGEVLGEHTVFFLGQADRLELTHRTADRAVFARGGLMALEKLIGKPAGLYTFAQLFDIC